MKIVVDVYSQRQFDNAHRFADGIELRHNLRSCLPKWVTSVCIDIKDYLFSVQSLKQPVSTLSLSC